MENKDGSIGWDEEVSFSDSGDSSQDPFVILPDGTYPFEVKKIERGSFKGSSKIPPCNQVKVDVVVGEGSKRSYVSSRFYMHTSTLWKILQFFESVGLRKKGDRSSSRIPWDKVEKGMTGTCVLTHRTYNNETLNDVSRWIPREDSVSKETSNESDEMDV